MKISLPSLIRGVMCVLFLFPGCGYTTSSSLPARLRTVHVETFQNKIDFTTESSRNIYFPLMEVKVRDAIINRFLFDGHLKIAKPEQAGLILRGELVGYDRTVLRYTDNDDVLEYRIQIVVNMVLWDTAQDEAMWEERGFVGQTEYFVTGSEAISESAAVENATEDLARRIVERAIENW